MTLIVSNRGPYRFEGEDHRALPAPGGLASGLRPLLSGEAGAPTTWVAAAIGDGDRAAARAGAVTVPGVDLTLLEIEPGVYARFNDVVANRTLWFLHHGLFDLPRRPRFDARFFEAWESFESVSEMFADAVAERAPSGATVLVQDYHLGLVPHLLRARRPDVRAVYFHHIPFFGPDGARVLPTRVAGALLSSLREVPCGFHSRRWASAYDASAREIDAGPGAPDWFLAPLGPDVESLTAAAGDPHTRSLLGDLEDRVGNRMLIVRSDRIELSKNVVRGFDAYGLLLERHPEWRGRVVFFAKLNASRAALPEYQAYRHEVEMAAARVNDRWASSDWQPVLLDTTDSYAQNLAGLIRYDVLLVNPLRDGMNLVAKEGPLVNERHGVLCLSPEAGAWDDLGEAALPVHPYDLEQTAAALHTALVMAPEERAAREQRLRALAARHTPRTWLAELVSHAR